MAAPRRLMKTRSKLSRRVLRAHSPRVAAVLRRPVPRAVLHPTCRPLPTVHQRAALIRSSASAHALTDTPAMPAGCRCSSHQHRSKHTCRLGLGRRQPALSPQISLIDHASVFVCQNEGLCGQKTRVLRSDSTLAACRPGYASRSRGLPLP
jgi:hypothetical protein